MTLDELLKGAIKHDDILTQSMIMFVVFDKKVRSLDDDISSLRVFYLDKHKDRMQKELKNYRKRMNIVMPPQVYKAENDEHVLYMYATNEQQALLELHRQGFKGASLEVQHKGTPMHLNGLETDFYEVVKGKSTPTILGGYKK